MSFTMSPEDCIHGMDMAQRFYGHEENAVIGLINVISPLKYDAAMLAAVNAYAQRRQPLLFACCSLPGATSPVTLAGTLAVNNAEVLAGIAYAQIRQPGLPVIYGNTTGSCDFRYVTPAIGAPETALFIQATAALARYYGIPSRTGGSLSDAKDFDWQAGSESVMTMMSTLMSGSHYILHSCGILDSFNTLCFEKYIMDEQNIQMLLHFTDRPPIEMPEEEFENIFEIGIGGQYLQSDHTMEHFRKELYAPRLFNRMSYEDWRAKGEPSAYANASAEVERRLSAYVVPESTSEQRAVLESYVGSLMRLMMP